MKPCSKGKTKKLLRSAASISNDVEAALLLCKISESHIGGKKRNKGNLYQYTPISRISSGNACSKATP